MDGNDYPEVDGNDPNSILIWRFDETIPCECTKFGLELEKGYVCPDCKGLERRVKTWTERIVKRVG